MIDLPIFYYCKFTEEMTRVILAFGEQANMIVERVM